MNSLAVVIATCRPESFRRWLKAWQPKLRGVSLYVVEDAPEKTRGLLRDHPYSYAHWSWKEIDEDLGSKTWVIPRRTSAIKSYGFMQAYKRGSDYIWTLDDDCFPEDGVPYVTRVTEALSGELLADSWFNTLSNGLYPRGFPYGIRQEWQPVMVHHGLWSGVPDLDGITALEHHKLRLDPVSDVHRVPSGQYFPMCGMNLAFRADMTPALYFMLQGTLRTGANSFELLPFDRFDDIWAGLFAKKVCDHFGYAVTSGAPSIFHTKESDPTQRVIKEGPGIAAHELLWPLVRDATLRAGTVAGAYAELAGLVDSAADDLPYPHYWHKLAAAMQIWTEFFRE